MFFPGRAPAPQIDRIAQTGRRLRRPRTAPARSSVISSSQWSMLNGLGPQGSASRFRGAGKILRDVDLELVQQNGQLGIEENAWVRRSTGSTIVAPSDVMASAPARHGIQGLVGEVIRRRTAGDRPRSARRSCARAEGRRV